MDGVSIHMVSRIKIISYAYTLLVSIKKSNYLITTTIYDIMPTLKARGHIPI